MDKHPRPKRSYCRFESDRGYFGLVTQWIECLVSTEIVGGSIPSKAAKDWLGPALFGRAWSVLECKGSHWLFLRSV